METSENTVQKTKAYSFLGGIYDPKNKRHTLIMGFGAAFRWTCFFIIIVGFLLDMLDHKLSSYIFDWVTFWGLYIFLIPIAVGLAREGFVKPYGASYYVHQSGDQNVSHSSHLPTKNSAYFFNSSNNFAPYVQDPYMSMAHHTTHSDHSFDSMEHRSESADHNSIYTEGSIISDPLYSNTSGNIYNHDHSFDSSYDHSSCTGTDIISDPSYSSLACNIYHHN